MHNSIFPTIWQYDCSRLELGYIGFLRTAKFTQCPIYTKDFDFVLLRWKNLSDISEFYCFLRWPNLPWWPKYAQPTVHSSSFHGSPSWRHVYVFMYNFMYPTIYTRVMRTCLVPSNPNYHIHLYIWHDYIYIYDPFILSNCLLYLSPPQWEDVVNGHSGLWCDYRWIISILDILWKVQVS